MSHEWSPYQQAIFEAPDDRNLTVEAVAGSGKTTTIVEMARRSPSLVCAFNKPVADELARRLKGTGSEGRTIHGLGSSTLWRVYRAKVDEAKYRQEIYKLGQNLADDLYGTGCPPDRRRMATDALRSLWSYCRSALTDMDEGAEIMATAVQFGVDAVNGGNLRFFKACLQQLAAFGRKGAAAGSIDFDDMIWLPYDQSLTDAIPQYRRVYVDEAQDLSAGRLWLSMQAGRGGRIVAVGDPRQAIYAFAGADCNAFARIAEETNSLRLPLSVCYRCAPEIVDLAASWCPGIESYPGHAPGKVELVKDQSPWLERVAIGDLILSRTTARAVEVTLQLLALGMPAKMRGRDIGRRLAGIVRDVATEAREGGKSWGVALDIHVTQRCANLQQGGHDDQAEAFRDLGQALAVLYSRWAISDPEVLAQRIESLYSDDGAAVYVSTIHRAKGLEYPRVWLLDYDSLPKTWKRQTADQLQQERNLVYVAITRAQNELYLVQSYLPKIEPLVLETEEVLA